MEEVDTGTNRLLHRDCQASGREVALGRAAERAA